MFDSVNLGVHLVSLYFLFFFFSSRRRHTRYIGDWSSDVCSSDLKNVAFEYTGLCRRSVAVNLVYVDPAVGILKLQVASELRITRGRKADAGSRRSEERRVGKGCRSGWAGGQWKKEREG